MLNKTIYIFLVLGLIASSINFALGQEQKNPGTLQVSVKGMHGFIFKHTDRVGHLAMSNPQGIQIELVKNTFGEKPWQALHNYPDLGISLSFTDLRNEVLGELITALPFIDFYLLRKKNSQITFRFGAGLAYATNPYHRENNNKNNMISSRISYGLQAGLNYDHSIADQWTVNAGISLNHVSNGAFRKPNKGINIVMASIGVNKKLGEKTVNLSERADSLFQSKLIHHIAFSSGYKDAEPIGLGKFPFVTLSWYVGKQLSPTNILNVGLDGFASWSVKEKIKFDDEVEPGDEPDFKRVGLAVGHELLFGRVSLLTQVGFYVYRPYKSDFPIYQRYGLKYYANDHWFGSIALKSHYGVADNVEFTVGVRL